MFKSTVPSCVILAYLMCIELKAASHLDRNPRLELFFGPDSLSDSAATLKDQFLTIFKAPEVKAVSLGIGALYLYYLQQRKVRPPRPSRHIAHRRPNSAPALRQRNKVAAIKRAILPPTPTNVQHIDNALPKFPDVELASLHQETLTDSVKTKVVADAEEETLTIVKDTIPKENVEDNQHEMTKKINFLTIDSMECQLKLICEAEAINSNNQIYRAMKLFISSDPNKEAYLASQAIGKSNASCDTAYPDCANSYTNLLSS